MCALPAGGIQFQPTIREISIEPPYKSQTLSSSIRSRRRWFERVPLGNSTARCPLLFHRRGVRSHRNREKPEDGPPVRKVRPPLARVWSCIRARLPCFSLYERFAEKEVGWGSELASILCESTAEGEKESSRGCQCCTLQDLRGRLITEYVRESIFMRMGQTGREWHLEQQSTYPRTLRSEKWQARIMRARKRPSLIFNLAFLQIG